MSDREDWLRGACPKCSGFGFIKGRGCEACDYTGFRAERVTSTGYGWRRLVFWPWHYVQHVRRGFSNSWRSRLFCTWCVDDRRREFSSEGVKP